jgi:uncharacterized DUF497 family protein
MNFEWNDLKSETNYKKHDVKFTEAASVWLDKNSIEFFDEDHSEEEERFLKIGFSKKDRVLLVVFCEREEEGVIRVISARKATRNERSQYERRI